jgi:hypothetical protein
MRLDELAEPREGQETRLGEQYVRLEEQGTKLEKQEMRLATELPRSAGAFGLFDN